MYFLEFIIKKLTHKQDKDEFYSDSEDKDYESCDHIFMPIDSTGEVLSCTKCGFIIHKG